MNDVSRLLEAAVNGDRRAGDELLPLVYNELRRLAARRMAAEHRGNTLNATALVHEAYLRLVGNQQANQWDGRGHFFTAAAEAMRRILVENARRRSRLKHGGEWNRVPLEEGALVAVPTPDVLVALDEALTRFGVQEPEAAKIVELRTSPAFRSTKRPMCSTCRAPPRTAFGLMPKPGCAVRFAPIE